LPQDVLSSFNTLFSITKYVSTWGEGGEEFAPN
jgi:hypothetical protein